MNPDNGNTPISDNEDQFTEGSYRAIKKKEQSANNSEEKKDSTKTITDIQNDTDPGSREDIAREQGPYGVQE